MCINIIITHAFSYVQVLKDASSYERKFNVSMRYAEYLTVCYEKFERVKIPENVYTYIWLHLQRVT